MIHHSCLGSPGAVGIAGPVYPQGLSWRGGLRATFQEGTRAYQASDGTFCDDIPWVKASCVAEPRGPCGPIGMGEEYIGMWILGGHDFRGASTVIIYRRSHSPKLGLGM